MRDKLTVLVLLALLALGLAAFLASHGALAVTGQVRDAETATPLAEAAVSVLGRTAHTDSVGHYRLAAVAPGMPIVAQADGYHHVVGQVGTPRRPFVHEVALDLALPPKVLAGSVRDAATGAPLAGVTVSGDGQAVTTDAAGTYRLARLRASSTLHFQADGYYPLTWPFANQGTLPVALPPTRLAGVVSDAETGTPLPGAQVAAGAITAQTNAAGAYSLERLLEGSTVVVYADGYLPAQAVFGDAARLDFALAPNVVSGTVRDTFTGAPLAGATVILGERQAQTDATGRYAFQRVPAGARLLAQAAGHSAAEAIFVGQVANPSAEQVTNPSVGQVANPSAEQVTNPSVGQVANLSAEQFANLSGEAATIDLLLRPLLLQGVVRDAATAAPIAGATVSLNGIYTHTASDGSYLLADTPDTYTLTVKAPGYRLAQIALGHDRGPDVALQPFVAKGLYLPYGVLIGDGGKKGRELLEMAASNGLNAVVVDVKSDLRGDVGHLAYKSDVPLAKTSGASRADSQILDDFLALARKKNVYTIARIIVFKDDVLARGAPDVAIKHSQTEEPWRDAGGSHWVDPYNAQVWAYNLAIAQEVAARGFDEVQLDYIRFPSDGQIADVLYPSRPPDDERPRWEVLEALLAQIPQELPHVYVSLDTFGWTTWRLDDSGVGQRIAEIARYVDYVCPMLYPSTFEASALGYAQPTTQPYQVVYRSSLNAQSRIAQSRARLRPWLQAFDDYAFGQPFGAKEIAAQIQAAEEAKTAGWCLWNPAGVYAAEGFCSE
jgi:hypothetical protein